MRLLFSPAGSFLSLSFHPILYTFSAACLPALAFVLSVLFVGGGWNPELGLAGGIMGRWLRCRGFVLSVGGFGAGGPGGVCLCTDILPFIRVRSSSESVRDHQDSFAFIGDGVNGWSPKNVSDPFRRA